MEARDVLADDMNVGGPEFGARAVVRETGGGDVVGQRVDPDIHHMLRIARNWYAPAEIGAADRKIGQAALDEGDDLVAIFFRRDEFGMGFVIREEPAGVGREAKKVALLLDPFGRSAARRKLRSTGAFGKLVLVEIGFVAHRVPAGILRQIDVAIGRHPLPDRLGSAVVSRLGRAYDVVGAGVQQFAHRLEFAGDPVDESLRRHSLARRGLLNLEAVFVHARDEQRLTPVEPHEPLDRVGRDALVGVADMRRAVGVRDRGRNVETAHARRPRAFSQ